MKFTKRSGHEGTIRKVWSDDKTKLFGVVGTVADLLAERVLDWCEYSPDMWCFVEVPVEGQPAKAWFADNREAVIAAAAK